VNKKLKQLKFRSWHRGMREMDILMGGFFDMFYKDFSDKEINQIEEYIIPLSDNDLYNCFIGKITWPNKISNSLKDKLKIYSNKNGLNNS
jgi:antitoxin CptB